MRIKKLLLILIIVFSCFMFTGKASAIYFDSKCDFKICEREEKTQDCLDKCVLTSANPKFKCESLEAIGVVYYDKKFKECKSYHDDPESYNSLVMSFVKKVCDDVFGEGFDYDLTYLDALDTSNLKTEPTSDGKPHCYKYLHYETSSRPMYYTTVWSDKKVNCGFEETNWSRGTCRDASLSNSVKIIGPEREDGSKGYTYIAHSGYNGVADFYDLVGTTKDTDEIICDNFKTFHFVYRMITILAPIVTLFFVSFDFVSSIIANDEKKMAKFRTSFIRRLIAFLILLVLPVLVSVLVNTLSKNKVIKRSSLISCTVLGETE